METKKQEGKILGLTKAEIEEIFIKHGLTPNWDYSKAGQSVIIPVRRLTQSVKQHDSPNPPKSDNEWKAP